MKLFIFKRLLFLSAIIVLTLLSNNSYAQIRYSETDTIDGVYIEYRWQRSKIFQKESRNILNLRLTNNNDYPVNIKFSVGFYESAIKFYESEEIEKCFNPGQRKRGGKAGLRFQSEKVTFEVIESEKFDWDFINFEVEETDKCS